MTDLDPDELRRISKTVADIYGDATMRLLEAVKRRMARGINEPGWAEAKLIEVAGLRGDAAKIIADLEAEAIPALRKAIEEAYGFGATAARTEMTVGTTLKPVTNQRAVEALARETITKVTGSHGGILRSVDDAFRAIISEVSAPGVVTGSESTQAAVQRALNRFADRGITGFVDKAGRNWALDTYAEMATRTSAGRAMIDGRIEQYVEDDRQFVIVSDSPQECKMCRPFEGKGLSLTGNGVGSKFGGIDIIATLDEARSKGFQHPNCFPGWVSVSGPTPTAGDRRWYEGDLVVIHTASGIELPVTPNHPILTPRGWVDAGSLDVGDHVIRHSIHSEGRGAAGDDPDEELRPSSISDAFSALWESSEMATMTVPASPEQFHGDGTIAGEVDVVAPARLLLDNVHASLGEDLGESGFGRVDVRAFPLLGEGTGFEVGVCPLHSPNSLMGWSDERLSVGVAHALPPADSSITSPDASVVPGENQVGCGLIDEEPPQLEASPDQSCANHLLADTNGGRDLADGLSALIAPDQIVDIDRYAWSGHVYNLQTTSGWYVANAIVVHNCTHDLRPIIPGLTKRYPSTEDPEGDRSRSDQRRLEYEARRLKGREAVAMDPADKAALRARRVAVEGKAEDLEGRRLRSQPSTPNPPDPPDPPRGVGAADDDDESGRSTVAKLGRMFAGQAKTAKPAERAAVRAWQSTDRFYQQVQRAIRTPGSVLSPEVARTIEGLDGLLRRSKLTEPVTVWRGVRSSTSTFGVPVDQLERLVGSALVLSGYLPTTALRDVAMEFTQPPGDGGPVMIRIVAPAGKHAVWVPSTGRADLSPQSELLFGGSTRIMIERIERSGTVTVVVGRML